MRVAAAVGYGALVDVWGEGRGQEAAQTRRGTQRQGGRGAEEETKLLQPEQSTSCLLCQPFAVHRSVTADDSFSPVAPTQL